MSSPLQYKKLQKPMDEKEVITKHEHVYYNNQNECRDASIWVYFVQMLSN